MNVSLTPRLAQYVQSQLGGDFANASEYIRDLLRRDMQAKQTVSLTPLSKRDLAEIAVQVNDDPVFERMSKHSAVMSSQARSMTVAQWDIFTAELWSSQRYSKV